MQRPQLRDRVAPRYIGLADDLAEIERLERASRIAQRFEELNDDDEGPVRPAWAGVVVLVVFVLALGLAHLIERTMTWLNAASIAGGM